MAQPGADGAGCAGVQQHAIHVALVNRGSLIAPFHNMMLISPATTARQVDRLVGSFGEIAAELAA